MQNINDNINKYINSVVLLVVLKTLKLEDRLEFYKKLDSDLNSINDYLLEKIPDLLNKVELEVLNISNETSRIYQS
jgi:hypothetical protein